MAPGELERETNWGMRRPPKFREKCRQSGNYSYWLNTRLRSRAAAVFEVFQEKQTHRDKGACDPDSRLRELRTPNANSSPIHSSLDGSIRQHTPPAIPACCLAHG